MLVRVSGFHSRRRLPRQLLLRVKFDVLLFEKVRDVSL